VYGPGDEVFSTLLKITRLSPVVPVIGSGDQPFEPIWHEDLARALAAAVERDDVAGRVLEVTSGERTSMSELIARLGGLEGRQPAQLPVPAGVVHIAERLAHAVGLPFPVDETKLTLLEEENVVAGENALPELIGTPTPLDEGLRRLLTTLPEQAPAEGVGNLHEKTIEADIAGTDVAPRELKRRVVSELGRVMPLETGGAAARGRSLRAGDVFTLELPLRGTVSMRVLESGPERLRLVTLEGHPIAGTAELLFEPGPRFTVRTLFRHGTLADAAAMAAGGGLLQDSLWRTVVNRVVEISGGHLAGDVRESSRVLDDEEAARVEREIADRIAARKRASRTPARRAASGPKRRKAPGSRRVRP
jgi:NADH dehydrogenase